MKKRTRSKRTKSAVRPLKDSHRSAIRTYEDWREYMPQWLKEIRIAVDKGDVCKARKLLSQEGIDEKVLGLKTTEDVYFALYEMAIQCFTVDMNKESLKYCLKSIKMHESGGAYNQLGLTYRAMGKGSLAIESLSKAKQLQPKDINIWNNLALCLMKVGKATEAIEMFKEITKMAPEKQYIYSNLLFHLHYMPEVETSEIFEEAKKWAQIHAPLSLVRKDHDNSPEPNRKLRIGYISPDFKRHSVMYFFSSLLAGHDRDNYEIYGYGNIDKIDSLTETVAKKIDFYRNIRNVADKDVAGLIRSDKIDILIELAGHTKGGSLSALAYKPAPIQVSYLGYPGTTGMKQVDYRLTDSIADTEDQQQYYTEELVFLPNGFLCYDPEMQPALAEPPLLTEKCITFGCFNNINKTNPELMKLWVEILNSVPESKLILKFAEAFDKDIEQYYYNKFEELGLENARDKIGLTGFMPRSKHLEVYNYVDISLDTYPYNGTTTTCQALLMGVPVITLTGQHHASRVGLDILSRLDMQFFSAKSPEEYVKKAVALASKPDSLAKIRKTMRQRLAASSLCNYKLITNDIENAYRQMWHRWCQSHKGVSVSDCIKPDKTAEIVVDDLNFTDIKTTKVGDISVGFNDKYVIKIEHGKHPWKLRTFSEEIEIIKQLNHQGCVSCPGLVSEGKLKNGERYFIQERFNNRRGFNAADMIFSILEQKSFGICEGDFKRDNFIFDNDSACHIIDYDQAIQDEQFIDMGNLEYLEWFNQFFVNRWKKLGLNFADIYSFGGFQKEKVLSLFKNDSFNLAETSIFQEQITTNTESGIYHSLNTDKVYIDGARNLDSRLAALNGIEFKKGEKVLDVGCNMGLLGHYLHDRGCKVTGIDMDEKIIIGAKMVANILNKDIQFKYLDLDTAGIEEDYDTICLFSVIHHVANFQQATENISQKCNRIILECSLQEHGAKPVQGRWMKSSGWEFNCSQDLIDYLETAFRGFKFQKYYGRVDRQREIMTFVKEPAMAGTVKIS
ncbi:MAG: O-linked N-acetylglucosamine transferase family protein [Planctomycetota bacterium]